MADFHLLFFLYTCDVAGFQMKVCLPAPPPDASTNCSLLPPQPHLPDLCRAITAGDKAGADTWRHSSHWSTLEQLVTAANSSPDHAPSAVVPKGSGEQWACQQCTLLNPAHSSVCEVCQLPRNP